MTTEQLNKGIELKKRINKLQEQLDLWNISASLYDKISLVDNNNHIICADINYINFDALRALTLANIQTKLNEARKEFEQL